MECANGEDERRAFFLSPWTPENAFHNHNNNIFPIFIAAVLSELHLNRTTPLPLMSAPSVLFKFNFPPKHKVGGSRL